VGCKGSEKQLPAICSIFFFPHFHSLWAIVLYHWPGPKKRSGA
jgi:hypothetical protein